MTEIDGMIHKSERGFFVSTIDREKVEEVLRGTDSQTVRGYTTMH